MSYEIRMPKLSDNMEEGTVIRWIVDKGQSVNAGDPIAEVETEKADVEIEAEQSGVVSEIVVAEGGVAAVGAVIAVLDGADGSATKSTEAGSRRKSGASASEKAEAGNARSSDGGRGRSAGEGRPAVREEEGATPEPRRGSERSQEGGDGEREPRAAERTPTGGGEEAAAPSTGGRDDEAANDGGQGAAPDDRRPTRAPRARAQDGAEHILASPMARELAARRGVDLGAVRGSGPGGRIVKADVESAAAATPATDSRGGEEEAAAPASRRPAAGGGEETMSRMRRTIAARMEKSKREIPHFYVRTEVDVGELMKLYETIRRDELVPGLTVTHLLLRAIALTMPDHPRLNALWVDDSIQLVDDVNIGIVVALDDGLLVPVLKRAQTLCLRDIVEQTRALIERTRKGRFRSEDLTGGTVSVSNIGMLDVDELTPVINPPHASILGVGAVRDAALVRDGALVAGRVMTLTLACDHRILHGVEAGRFLEDLKHALERPLAMMVLAG